MADTPPPRTTHLRTTDLRGASRLAVDATLGLTDLVENLHHNITRVPGPLGEVSRRRTRGITGLVYRSIRGVTRLVGGSVDALLGQLAALLGPGQAVASPEREAVLAALNGVLGDHLQATGNPLATAMHLRHDGRPLDLDPVALARALPQAGGRVLLLVHGLCMNGLQWRRQGHDHGAALAAAGGDVPLYLHYNSGLHVSTNGRLLADRLQQLVLAWPVPVQELVILGHSMGGLVARSAVAQAQARGDAWPRLLRKLVFLGTPHHGAPLERGGHWIDAILGASPYTAAFARLGKLRSAGITDLRHGSLLDQDWAGDHPFAHGHDTRTPVPLPAGVDCYAIAGSLGREPDALRGKLLGDGLVPLDSALGQHRQAARQLQFQPDHQWVAQGVNHLDLLCDAAVAAQLRAWLVTPSACG
ncbi:MAG: GPI inositol-deacylase [Burkholderiales bacterium]|nr:GPI inositol-deacylase [Burkholderiales bacterium]